MVIVHDSTRFYCTICTRSSKGFKNHAGLQQHKTSKHSTYNLLPNHIQQIPESELCHLKDAIIKELQKKLKNHYHAVGKQVFSLYYSEMLLLDYLTIKFFRLYIPEKQDISKKNNETYCSNKNSKPPKKSKSKLFPNDEMIIEWRLTGFKDKANYEYKAGMLQIHFFLDQCQL
ncbi:hypothetical protein F8M41_016415 [Gigaspora margarita]|uniref:C2H2-type domain-containing protein n=1 Tax=Gigaspora margarita TaxID=4874 RepID=A0A8H4EMR2_GIGMA|nr:hypothetical protein F8M41_016415 [Gigaspora margarita]